LRLLEDDNNRKANHGNLGLVCMVPANMEEVARAVLEIGPVAGQTGNSGVFKGIAKVMVNPYIAAATNERFFLFATSKPVKALVYQKREPWEFQLKTDGDDWDIDDTGYMISRGRWEFGIGDHKKTVRCVLT
jgi:phage major head subunit gpT-like protein